MDKYLLVEQETKVEDMQHTELLLRITLKKVVQVAYL